MKILWGFTYNFEVACQYDPLFILSSKYPGVPFPPNKPADSKIC